MVWLGRFAGRRSGRRLAQHARPERQAASLALRLRAGTIEHRAAQPRASLRSRTPALPAVTSVEIETSRAASEVAVTSSKPSEDWAILIARARHLARAVAWPAAVTTILVLAAGIRTWEINRLGLNSDEAVYVGQAASIADAEGYRDFFPIFRAHPLLYPTMVSFGFWPTFLSIGLRFVGPETFPRLAAMGFGVATVAMVFELGRFLYGRRVGAVAALFVAVMPYHVIVTRQALLDGPMTAFATLTLYLLCRYAASGQRIWLYGAAVGMGLTFLTKETGILQLGAVYAFFALVQHRRPSLGDAVIACLILLLQVSPFLVSLKLSGRSEAGGSYLQWQLFRQPNHSWTFYPSVVPEALGYLTLGLACVGLWTRRRDSSWRETMLIAWILIPTAFFQFWPTKGFQYLLPSVPAVAVLAARALGPGLTEGIPRVLRRHVREAYAVPIIVALTTLTLLVPTLDRIHPNPAQATLAGTGGLPGGREAGEWINANVPEGTTFMTVGPTMANIVEFYGRRTAYGLSVSPNPLKRNPSYLPILNPDLRLRNNEIQYIVWDAFSARRSSFFGDKVLNYARRYNGRVVHTETTTVRTANGELVEQPIIIIYQVRP